MVKLVKVGKKQAKPKKAAPPPPPEDFEESTSEEESEEEELPKAPVKKTATPTAKATPQSINKKNGKAVKKESSEDEEDDDEEEEESEEESEEEKPMTKQAAKLIEKAEEDDEVDDDEEDDDEEDNDESEEEEAMDTAPAPKVKKAGMVKAKKDDEDEEEEEDDEDEEEEEDDEDEEEEEDDEDEEDDKGAVPVKSGKRKKEEQKAATPAKKQKTSGCAFSLFVGNLNSEKNFEELKKALNDFFTKKKLAVSGVRIGSSRKFGYVDFETEEQLEKALEFNGNKVLGQVVKLDKARSKESNPVNKDRDCRTLFVKNLPFKITQDDLREIFEDAIDIRIPTARDGSGTRGIAYIEFETEAAAETVLKEKQGIDVEGRSIVIDFTGTKSAFNAKSGQTQQGSDTLMVNNLAYSATEITLQNIFEKASLIKIPEKNGKPKGFAIVKFESTEDAKEALEGLNNTEIEGRTVRLEFFNQGQRGGDGASKTLFIRGLSDDTTEETLKEAFEGAESARIVTDRDSGRSKGFGFVDFASAEDAKSAMEMMEDGEIDGCKIILHFARPKNENQRGGGRGGFGRGGFGRGGIRGRGGFGGRGGGRGGGGRGGFGGFRGGKKIKFD